MIICKEPLEISKGTLTFLQQCLSSVVKQGTGSLLNQLHHFKIKGKSGTAQVQSLEKQILSKEHMPHGYFAAHFQYKTEKPRTLVILLDHAGSSTVAIRYACAFLKRYANITESRSKQVPH